MSPSAPSLAWETGSPSKLCSACRGGTFPPLLKRTHAPKPSSSRTGSVAHRRPKHVRLRSRGAVFARATSASDSSSATWSTGATPGAAQPWRRSASAAAVKLPPVLSPGAGALLRLLLQTGRSDEELSKGLAEASARRGGGEDIFSCLTELRKLKKWNTAIEVYEWLLLTPGLFKADVRNYNLVLDAYARTGQANKCQAVFQAMQEGASRVRGAVEGWRGASLAPRTARSRTPSPAPSAVPSGVPSEAPSLASGGEKVTEGRDGDGASSADLEQVSGEDSQCIPSEASWNILISAFSAAGDLEEAQRVFGLMQSRGYIPSLVTSNTMLEVLGKSGKVNAAEELFRRMQKGSGPVPSVSSHTLMIAAYARAGMPDRAEALFRSMYPAYLVPDRGTFLVLLSAFARADMARRAVSAFQGMLRMGFDADVDACNAVLAAHGTDPEGALRWFESISDVHGLIPDSESHRLVLEALAYAGRWQDCEEHLAFMPPDSNVDSHTMRRLQLEAYAAAGEVERLWSELSSLEATGNALAEKDAAVLRLKALGRAARLEEMFALLETLQSKESGTVDLAYLNVLLEALGRQGLVDKAKDLFEGLEAVTGSKPDSDSYAAMMTAHAGKKSLRKCMVLLKRMVGEGVAPGLAVRRAMVLACRSEAQEEEVHGAFSTASQQRG